MHHDGDMTQLAFRAVFYFIIQTAIPDIWILCVKAGRPETFYCIQNISQTCKIFITEPFI